MSDEKKTKPDLQVITKHGDDLGSQIGVMFFPNPKCGKVGSDKHEGPVSEHEA